MGIFEVSEYAHEGIKNSISGITLHSESYVVILYTIYPC